LPTSPAICRRFWPDGGVFGNVPVPQLIGNRHVKDKETDLTREPEMVKAYRDTWRLGIYSYLSYLRDRLIVARELLADTGSIFVQIGDENLHRARTLINESFGAENHVSTITYKTSIGLGSEMLDGRL
jgi:adenine-specific DNA-methyltransferase